MHSFHHSRGRILFEAACALMISASCVAAWKDLGVPAFLAVAAVSALYAFVRLFDMRRPKAVMASAIPAVAEPEANAVEQIAGAVPADPETIADAPAPPATPKKRRSAKKVKPVVEIAPVEPPEPVVETPPAEPEAYEDHSPVVPLFEPEPFVRQQQRALFGRKAG